MMRAKPRHAVEQEIAIAAGPQVLRGNLCVPEQARGMVLFAHGSGSSRHSPRNRFVAAELVKGGCATLLMDLLTAAEEEEDAARGHLRFDIEFLAARVLQATRWLREDERTRDLPIGYFGASTGAAAALVAAAEEPEAVRAIVSRGGRPDLAGSALRFVTAPTLLIVGGDDYPVIDMNRAALARLAHAESQLAIIPGATHLFEEPGTLEEVTRLAGQWFSQHLLQEEIKK